MELGNNHKYKFQSDRVGPLECTNNREKEIVGIKLWLSNRICAPVSLPSSEP